jgi:hypothetical protein
MTIGHCPHGEFELAQGCPKCVEAFRNLGEDNPESPVSIVKVRYIKLETGEPTGREYSYFTAEPLGLDFHVKAPTQNGYVEAVVTALDVPEVEVAAFRDRVRTISAGSIMVRPAPEIEIPTTQVVFPMVETPPVAQVAKLFDQEPEPEDVGPYPPGLNDGEVNEEAQESPKPAALATIETQVGKPTSELFKLYLEAASLLQFAKNREIKTNEDLKPATDDLAIIAVCKKKMYARKTEFVGPLKTKLDLVNKAFSDLMFPVEEADRATRAKVNFFTAEQTRLAAEAREIEVEKYNLAQREMELKGEHTQDLNTAVAPPPVPELTRTDMGTLGGRANWKAKVVDFALLPDQYKLPNESLLNSHARSTKGQRPIPGVEFYDERIVTMRTK